MHHPINKDLQNFIETRMKKQQEESESDAKWLRQQEDNIKKRLSLSSLNDMPAESMTNPQPKIIPPVAAPSDRTPLSPKMSMPLQQISPISSSINSPQDTLKSSEPKVLERQNDPIYKSTTNVVRAIMTLSSGVEKSSMGEYLDLVKAVGLELRNLLGTVDQISSQFPSQTHRYLFLHEIIK